MEKHFYKFIVFGKNMKKIGEISDLCTKDEIHIKTQDIVLGGVSILRTWFTVLVTDEYSNHVLKISR